MRSPCRRGQPRLGALCLLLCLLFGAALPGSVPPLWWRKGRAREKLGSRAEAELLCQLAVLLMPDVPIAEAFREFPVKKCKEWGSNKLSPDLTAYGVLKATDAALFVEYDGYYRHMEPPGLARDMRKTSALLKFAPAGSVVVRIAHKERRWKDKSTQVLVDSWCAGHEPSLLKALNQVAASLLKECRGRLHPTLASRLESFAEEELDTDAGICASEAELVGMSDSSRPKLEDFLCKEVGFDTCQVAKVIATFPSVVHYSIEANLKPTVEWIKGLGLSQSQVAKVIARSPPVLGLSIEANMKPKVEWIKRLGLSQSQVAKVIVQRPHVLGYSIEANLKPTVEWIKGLGLSQSQVAQVISQRPQVLGLSIEANLKPAVEWMKGLGMSQFQVGNLIAAFPPVLGLRIGANLSAKHRLLREYLTGAQAAQLLAKSPQLWGYRYARLEHRLSVLKSHNQLSKLAGAMTLPLDAFSRRYPGT